MGEVNTPDEDLGEVAHVPQNTGSEQDRHPNGEQRDQDQRRGAGIVDGPGAA
jgi:hypothetical protein